MRIIRVSTLGKAMELSSKYVKMGRGVRINKVKNAYELRVIARQQN